jgi:hypothetical protein
MCIICLDFDRGALKLAEARRALGEMRATLEPDHVEEIEEKLAEAEAKAESPPSDG